MESVCVVYLAGSAEPFFKTVLLCIVKFDAVKFQNCEEGIVLNKTSFVCDRKPC